MNIHVEESNRSCVAEEGRLSIRAAKKQIYREKDVCGDFTIVHTHLPAFKRTKFKVFGDGKELLVVATLGKIDQGDSLEIHLDPHHDHMGFFQFVFPVAGGVQTYTHLPYNERHSSAFPSIRLKGHQWDADSITNVVGARDNIHWLFARFSLEGIFRSGERCGFNVARCSTTINEPTSWNSCTGSSLQDATGFGHLYYGAAPVQVSLTRAMLKDGRLELEGQVFPENAPLSLELVDPLGARREIHVTTDGGSWRGTAILEDLIGGRYRLYPTSDGKCVEPEFLFFDLLPSREKRPFSFSLTYDIPDDLRANAYTPERLQRQISQLSDCGITRIYWIDYPEYKDFPAFWEGVSNRRQVMATFRECGDLLSLAAKVSKQKGMDFYGVFKPFDLGFQIPAARLPRSPSEAIRRGLVKDLDQRYVVAWPEIAAHQEWTMQANPFWAKEFSFPVTRLRFYSQQPIPALEEADVALWVSTDNRDFERYVGPCRVTQGVARFPHYRWTPAGKARGSGTRRNWYLQLSALALDSPFVAIEVKEKDVRLVNQTFLLVEASDCKGREVPVTLGSGSVQRGLSFGNRWSWANYTEDIVDTLTREGGTLGLAFAERSNLPTLFEPSYPEVRRLWLGQVERILETEADGVDIRTLCQHNTCDSWLKYAFATPVRETFRERFGRDVEATPEDYERVRRIRGEYYTDFIRQAKQLAARYGKKLAVHLEPGIEVPVRHNIRMQMAIEWERWLAEGLIDEITLKYWGAQSAFVHERVLPIARKSNIPVHICDRNFSLTTPRAVELAERLVCDAYAAGFAGFSFYEVCSHFFLNREGVSWPIGHSHAALRDASEALLRLQEEQH